MKFPEYIQNFITEKRSTGNFPFNLSVRIFPLLLSFHTVKENNIKKGLFF